ncbi:MAG: alpha-amylase, partial [Ignavibacteriales bacterium]|nr:alpha-amylase [Ignavibacteriales bacterium]
MNKITKWVILFSLLFFISPVVLFTQFNNQVTATTDNSRSDVIIQGFYWNCTPGGLWWDSLFQLAPQLASAGYGAVWFPSHVKGMAGGWSMGYDPYDHYDFGQYNQCGSVETRFGSRQELINAINTYHNLGMEIWADAVMR